MTDLSIILPLHREGLLLGPSLASLAEAIVVARAGGIATEIVAVLDRADRLTEAALAQALADNDLTAEILRSDLGDPGQSRNHGLEAARGPVAALVDGDDLVSENWLLAGWQAQQARPDAIWHSDCNLVFGSERSLWWHVDSEGPLFDPDYPLWLNCWDAMSLAATAIYRQHPFRANDLSLGFGHEDWHWNRVTLAAGHAHKPVAGTMHFKRRRSGSQMARVSLADGVCWPVADAPPR